MHRTRECNIHRFYDPTATVVSKSDHKIGRKGSGQGESNEERKEDLFKDARGVVHRVHHL